MKKISWKELIDLRNQGLSDLAISKIFNVTPESIINWLAAGEIGRNHSYKEFEKNDDTVYFSFHLSKEMKNKLKMKAKKEKKFLYQVLNEILEYYFKKTKKKNDRTEYFRQYYQANKIRLRIKRREYNRKYYQVNREKILDNRKKLKEY